MAEWSARRTRNPAVPGSCPASSHLLDLCSVVQILEFKFSATLVNSQLVRLPPASWSF